MAVVVALASTQLAPGASSNTVVSATIPSATTVGAAGCAPSTAGITEFGTVQPGTTAVTTADCVVTWGASNATSMLRTYQSDGFGTAMSAPDPLWTLRTVRDGTSYESVSAADASTAYFAAGGNGFSATSDSGATWRNRPALSHTWDVAVAPGAAATAFGVTNGGHVYRTTDTGTNWILETSGVPTSLRQVSMVDATNGFAVGAGGVVRRRTTVGGSTWTAATSPVAANLTGVSAFSPMVAFVVAGPGNAYRTEDGGLTWSSTTSGCFGFHRDVRAVDANTAYAVGTAGSAARITWTSGTSTLSCAPVATGIGEDLHSVTASGGVFHISGVLGTLLRSADAGASWTRLNPGTAANLTGVSTPADGAVWVAGSSGTVALAPTGTTFTVRRAAGADSTTLTDVAAVSARTAFVVGGQVDRGATWQAAIRRTTDAGATWTSLTSNTMFAMFGVWADHDGTNLLAVGDGGTVVRSTDSGATWTTQVAAPGVRLWDVDLADRYRGWAVGDGGTILRTTNGGLSWTAQVSPAPVSTGLRAVSAVDENTAFAVGMSGRVLRTTDGGATWAALTSIPTTAPLDDVSAASADAAWIAYGYQGVMRTTNGSAPTPSWTDAATGSSQDAMAIDAVSPTAAFVASASGSVSRTRTAATTWESTFAPGTGGAYLYGIDAVDENTAWAVGTDNLAYLTQEVAATAIGDYADAGPNWAGAGSAFGVCMRSSTGTNVVPTWTPDASCTPSGTGVWRAVPATSVDAGAKVAGATSATVATTRLRFGFRAAANQPPGRYSAGLAFVVVAPDA